MRKSTKKTNTTKMSRKRVAEKDTAKKEPKESMVRPLKMDQIGEKALALGLTIEGLSTVELIKGIQRSEGNFDCFGTADSYCDQWECCWRTFCLSQAK